MFNVDSLDVFTRAYIECALWSSTDDEGNPLDAEHSIEDIAPEAMQSMIADCKSFQETMKEDLREAYASEGYELSQAGHDFLLTRNGHGSGFWDRGLGETGEALTNACGWRMVFCEIDLYIGDEGKIYA